MFARSISTSRVKASLLLLVTLAVSVAQAQQYELYNTISKTSNHTESAHNRTSTFTPDKGTLIGLALTSIITAMSMSVGIGGGGVLVPVYNLVVGFSIHDSTSLSQATIAAAGIGGLVYSLTHSHPTKPNTPLIDVDLACVLTPSLLLGISAGVLFNTIAPIYVLTAFVASVLAYMAVRTTNTALRIRKSEQALRHHKTVVNRLQDVVVEYDFGSAAASSVRAPDSDIDDDEGIDSVEEGYRYRSGGSSSTGGGICGWLGLDAVPEKWIRLGQLCAVWIVFVGLQAAKSQVHHCTLPFLFFYLLQLFIVSLASIYFVQQGSYNTSHNNNDDGVENNHNSPTSTTTVATPISLPLTPTHNSRTSSAAAAFATTPPHTDNNNNNNSTQEYDALEAFTPTGHIRDDDSSLLTRALLSETKRRWEEQHDEEEYEHDEKRTPIRTRNNNNAAVGSGTVNKWSRQELVLAALAATGAGVIAGFIGIGGGMLLNPLMVDFGVDPAISSATSGLMVLMASSSATVFFIAEQRLNLQYAAVFGAVCLLSTFVGSKLLAGVVKRHGVSLMMFVVAVVIALGCFTTVVVDGPLAVKHYKAGDGFRDFC